MDKSKKKKSDASFKAAIQASVNEWTKPSNRHVEPRRAIHMMHINNSFLALAFWETLK